MCCEVVSFGGGYIELSGVLAGQGNVKTDCASGGCGRFVHDGVRGVVDVDGDGWWEFF